VGVIIITAAAAAASPLSVPAREVDEDDGPVDAVPDEVATLALWLC